MNYEKDIRIDENALDVEWLQQASLTFHYSKNAAFQRKQLDLVKENLNVVRAELDREIRNDPEAFDIAKVTEAALTAAIISHKRYKEANNAYLEAKYEADIADAAVRALQDKRSALENLVKLHAAQYFAGPSMPRDISREWVKTAEQKQTNMAVATGMTRKPRNI